MPVPNPLRQLRLDAEAEAAADAAVVGGTERGEDEEAAAEADEAARTT